MDAVSFETGDFVICSCFMEHNKGCQCMVTVIVCGRIVSHVMFHPWTHNFPLTN